MKTRFERAFPKMDMSNIVVNPAWLRAKWECACYSISDGYREQIKLEERYATKKDCELHRNEIPPFIVLGGKKRKKTSKLARI